MAFILGIPIIGHALFCFLVLIPIAAPILVWQGFVMLFDGDAFVGLIAIAFGVAACIFTWPLAWEAIQVVFNLFS